ncbi:metal ABC transporter ATP-binding protein [Campylobacter estrildidarum]|uniref:Metal ABC transporter ATP-binding protein n=1 Tax=Campylobacter estrildidarum TaxID=2510189 RepID=A0A4U7BH70_9BACT|nr:metal ABC transporter ATP-binding protein [Campylobacter estrildidarum]TKX31053.1 metal ABC transporter ATP-binding protein [Campylobacter estrildidarum]
MEFFCIRNLNYSYNQEYVLKNINLSYDNKDFLSIIGPNGAGKSTLVKLILGLLNSKNAICFSGIKRNEIGYVPQHTLANPNFFPRVIDIVLMGLVNKKIFGFYSKNDKEKAMMALKNVKMQDFWDKKVNELSGGQRQRVFIARALVDECKMLILDEPTASVDSKSAIQIFELLTSLHEKGIGILLVCHDINLVLTFSDKIAHLNKELFLHSNQKEKEKSDFLKHLYENHSHFCDVEMSLNSCLCDTNCYYKESCQNKENCLKKESDV